MSEKQPALGCLKSIEDIVVEQSKKRKCFPQAVSSPRYIF